MTEETLVTATILSVSDGPRYQSCDNASHEYEKRTRSSDDEDWEIESLPVSCVSSMVPLFDDILERTDDCM